MSFTRQVAFAGYRAHTDLFKRHESETVDFANLSTRLRQNSAAEKLTSLWIDHLFAARLMQTV